MVPEVITYNALIRSSDKCRQPERALGLFKAMQWEGLVPDVITYNALISARSESKRHGGAPEVSKAM